ncbi:hypothetical protein M422DRAFT_54507 [Sphaerobolus stellatus SS14]|uniref:Uncharacterized protein n=1 Tax=Sphaerobolus stellatus (strain SS14) TaxID=990650 RepID=A0A0C9TGY0_SPHS4|nr:hypothetical protein M422DRAFT_54507 [Sphaerobolus stellatus SS14]
MPARRLENSLGDISSSSQDEECDLLRNLLDTISPPSSPDLISVDNESDNELQWLLDTISPPSSPIGVSQEKTRDFDIPPHFSSTKFGKTSVCIMTYCLMPDTRPQQLIDLLDTISPPSSPTLPAQIHNQSKHFNELLNTMSPPTSPSPSNMSSL